MKQLGRKPYRIAGDDEDVYQLDIRLEDRKGGDMDEWPEYLRVREFPR